MSGEAWVSIRRRAAACGAEVFRTDPADGPVVYLWSGGNGVKTFPELAQLRALLEDVELRKEEEARWRSTRPPMTPEERHIQSLQGQIGGLGATIYAYTKQLAGERVIGRITLVMAQAEGRDHLKDLATWRANAIRERLRIADELASFGKRPPRYAEYLAAAKALEAGGPADGN